MLVGRANCSSQDIAVQCWLFFFIIQMNITWVGEVAVMRESELPKLYLPVYRLWPWKEKKLNHWLVLTSASSFPFLIFLPYLSPFFLSFFVRFLFFLFLFFFLSGLLSLFINCSKNLSFHLRGILSYLFIYLFSCLLINLFIYYPYI